jgi:hypothetical protein
MTNLQHVWAPYVRVTYLASGIRDSFVEATTAFAERCVVFLVTDSGLLKGDCDHEKLAALEPTRRLRRIRRMPPYRFYEMIGAWA